MAGPNNSVYQTANAELLRSLLNKIHGAVYKVRYRLSTSHFISAIFGITLELSSGGHSGTAVTGSIIVTAVVDMFGRLI